MSQTWRQKGPYLLLGLASAAYMAITLLGPLDDATYNLSTSTIRLLQLTIELPVIVIWSLALWGSLRFRQYATRIAGSPDGKALTRLSSGLLVLVGGLVAVSLLQAFNPYMRQAGHLAIWSVVTNYLSLALSLAAFWYVHAGAKRLGSLVSFKGLGRGRWVAMALLALSGGAYAWLVASNPLHISGQADQTVYYLPGWLTLATIILPYLAVWYLGLMAATYLRLYRIHSRGVIYRKAVSRLAVGLVAIITTSLLIQLLTVLGQTLRHLGLSQVLLLVYILVLFYGLGHVLVAAGARQLAKIEEAK